MAVPGGRAGTGSVVAAAGHLAPEGPAHSEALRVPLGRWSPAFLAPSRPLRFFHRHFGPEVLSNVSDSGPRRASGGPTGSSGSGVHMDFVSHLRRGATQRCGGRGRGGKSSLQPATPLWHRDTPTVRRPARRPVPGHVSSIRFNDLPSVHLKRFAEPLLRRKQEQQGHREPLPAAGLAVSDRRLGVALAVSDRRLGVARPALRQGTPARSFLSWRRWCREVRQRARPGASCSHTESTETARCPRGGQQRRFAGRGRG